MTGKPKKETEMLILTRKLGESITIGDDITVTVLGIKGGQIKIGIKAPPESLIMRDEVSGKIKELNVIASGLGADDLASIANSWDGRRENVEVSVED